jgi:Tol biopolymer transport system component
VPSNAFTDPENDALTYSASQSNNLPLPTWLSFDPATLTFSGTPSTGNEGTLELQVRATDTASNNVSNIFKLTVNSTGGVTNPTPTGIRRITQAPDGTASDGDSRDAAISNDGRYVVYRSEASNLVDSDPNGGGSTAGDIFLFDRDTGANTLIASGFTPDISGNGRYITYDDLILDRDTNTTTTFVKALNGATPTSPFGSVGNNASISDDGRYIAYYSYATNLVSDDTNDNSDIFLYDRETDTTIKVSSGAGFSNVPQISGDGNFIVYGQNEDSVYLYDRLTGTNIKICSTKLS